MKVRSAADWWLSLLMGGAAIIVVVTMIGVPAEEKLLSLIVGVPSLVFMVWIYFGTWYELRATCLLCRSGPFFQRIPYGRIRSLRLCTSILASLALSVDRIEIRQHGKGFVLGTTYISPAGRENFLRELALRCPNLEVPP